jgi:hypothetical protein
MQVPERSLFVEQIMDAMRPLIGSIEGAEIRKFGLAQASAVYDRLLPERHLNNGIPHPGTVTKGQAVAEAFAIASKRLNLSRFVDFSEIDFLLSEGHKDAAAVMCGSELEKHLRKLCVSNGIDVFLPAGSAGELQPKRAERLNAELASINVYGKLDQKHITSWLDLRNKAAHGDYHEYNAEQVSLMIQGVREFVTRYPA